MKKMKEKIAKFTIALMVVITIILAYGNQKCFATSELSISGILQQGNDFITVGQSQQEELTEEKIIIDFLPIGRVLVAVATAVVFIVAIIMGIKWITASPDQQATLKKQLLGLVVSIIVIYGAVGIWTLIRNIMQTLTA